MYPYSDDYLIYNTQTHKYQLTEKAVLEHCGVNLIERVRDINTVKSILYQNSVQVYSYIHQYNHNNDMQDYIIAKTRKGRQIIQTALEQQLLYVLSVGDNRKTSDKEKRMVWFDEYAKDILLEPIPEIGVPILYTGTLYYKSEDKTEW